VDIRAILLQSLADCVTLVPRDAPSYVGCHKEVAEGFKRGCVFIRVENAAFRVADQVREFAESGIGVD
jgi:hypothetical protein